MVVWDPIEIAALQVGNCVVGYPDTVGADLLIVADYHHFLGDIKQEGAINPELTGLIDDDEVIAFRFRIDHFGHQVTRHNPDRNRVAAFVHISPSLTAQASESGRSSGSLPHGPDCLAPTLQGSFLFL